MYIKKLNKTCKKLNKFDSNKLDYDCRYLKKAFNICYENKLFTLYKYDLVLQEKLKFKLFSTLTKYSGNLSFLAIQILAANMIMNKNNFSRKEFYFNKKCGIAINHLRAPKTYVSAKRFKNGYLLSGNLTWASGYKIFDKLLIGFHFEGREYEVLSNFKNSKEFQIIDNPKTFVGFGLNTVNVKLENFFVKNKNVVSSNEIGNYTKNKSLSKTVHYAIYGLAKGAINEFEDKNLKKSLSKKLKVIKESFTNSKDGEELDKIRIKLFKFTQDTITLGMVQKGGISVLSNENLQRFYRELIMFNSNGLNSKIKTHFLENFWNLYS